VAVGILGILGTVWGFYRAHRNSKILRSYNDAYNAIKETFEDKEKSLLTKAIKSASEFHNVAKETRDFYKKFESSGAKDKIKEHLALLK